MNCHAFSRRDTASPREFKRKCPLLPFLLCLILAFPFPARAQKPSRRGLFVSVIQEPAVLSGRNLIDTLIADAARLGIDTLFVQIYRSGKAWFPSGIADARPYRDAVKNVGEDPFSLLIKKAGQHGIRVHAWLNMMSLGANPDAPLLTKYGPGILTRNGEEKNSIEDYRIDDQYFLEPGDPRVRRELLGMLEEVLRAYPDLDGVLFDYLRYPDVKPAYGHTEINESRFRETTGQTDTGETNEAWRKWKRDQVTECLVQLAARARALMPRIEVAATGCAPYARAYAEAFQDWPAWMENGITDFVIYMNYSSDPGEYTRFVAEAKPMVRDLSKWPIGVPAYKLTGSPETFARLYETCAATGESACVVFHYGSLVENPALEGPLLADTR